MVVDTGTMNIHSSKYMDYCRENIRDSDIMNTYHGNVDTVYRVALTLIEVVP